MSRAPKPLKLLDPSYSWINAFSESQLDQVRRWPNAATHMQPSKPLALFTVEVKPIVAARIEAITRRVPLYAVDGPEDAMSRGR